MAFALAFLVLPLPFFSGPRLGVREGLGASSMESSFDIQSSRRSSVASESKTQYCMATLASWVQHTMMSWSRSNASHRLHRGHDLRLRCVWVSPHVLFVDGSGGVLVSDDCVGDILVPLLLHLCTCHPLLHAPPNGPRFLGDLHVHRGIAPILRSHTP